MMSKHRSYGEGSAILPPSTIPSHLTRLGCDPDFSITIIGFIKLSKKADRLGFGWLFSTLRSNYGKENRKSPFM